jgi:hypothetical protein
LKNISGHISHTGNIDRGFTLYSFDHPDRNTLCYEILHFKCLSYLFTYLFISRKIPSPFLLYHSVQNLWSYLLLSGKVKIRFYNILILPVILYGCGTWFLTLRQKHRLRVFEQRLLRISGLINTMLQEAGENWVMKSCITRILYKNNSVVHSPQENYTD